MIFSCKIYADLRVTFLDKIRTILGICPANKNDFTKTTFDTSNRLAIVYRVLLTLFRLGLFGAPGPGGGASKAPPS